ncbi:adenylate cyclase [Rhodanobacter sp. ANJX3]|uniref:CYTH domain-containing protein n=1 Tax=unclassified Rhodanobacter TaxID=2621553 RepID=UPI0015C7B148|nr:MULTISPECIES: CYTH domain-containing protein [unclassified Rhodanobacter]MBB5357415.1 adenylate cyclase [Rhodanobacter sp. ANJX3]NYE27463.1 adenylate cyclase [Rhodanobacter sp. K2T2]
MAIEIERKFLLRDDSWRAGVSHSKTIAQGYLVGAQALRNGDARASVRARIAGDQAWLNIKAAVAGIERAEFEYAIALADAQALLATLCDGVLEKIRHHVHVGEALFEIDEFLGENQGLIVAEIELSAVDAAFPKPAWLGAEVSALTRYYNVNLIAHPFTQWSPAERAAEDAAC